MGPQGSIYQGKTLDEAVRKGLQELGLSRAEVMITMLEEGSGGFLGFGARPYKVRISARPGGAIPEPAEGGDRARGRGDRGRDRERGRGQSRDRGGRGGRREERGTAGAGAGAGATTEAPRGEGRSEGRVEGRAERGDRSSRRGGRDAGGRDGGGRDAGGRDGGRRDEPRAARRDEPRADRGAPEPRGERAPEPSGERSAEPRSERSAQARPDRGPRGEGRREGRRDERGESRREERSEPREEREKRSPAGVDRMDVARPPAPDAAAAPRVFEQDDAGEGDDGRRRRRRGRRGGRRRGAGAEGGAPAMTAQREAETPMMNTPEADEPHTFAAVATERAAYSEQDDSPARSPAASHSETPALSEEALAAEGKKWTVQLLQAMGFECTVDAKAEADHVDVTVKVAANDDLLTGPKGEVRQAMQHLLNRMINRGEGSRYHLQLEINDFWAQRESELETLARSMAESALAGNEEIVSEYLNAQERRVIHVTLREDTRVKTYALGNGMIKRIAVAPAGAPGEARDDE